MMTNGGISMKRSTYTLRRLLALVLVLVMTCSLFAGCNRKTDDSTVPQEPSETAAETAAPTDEPTDAPTEEATEAPTEPEETVPPVIMGTVNADNLNVRTEPYSTADILKRLAINTRIEILEQKIVDGVNWGRIAEGWLNLNYVTIGDDVPGSDIGNVIENGNNIGSGDVSVPDSTKPSTGSSSTGSGTSSSGTSSGTSSKKVSNGNTVALGNAVVKEVSSLAVRTGPGTNYDSVGFVRRGESHSFFQTSGNWIRLSKGWVNSSYTTVEYTIDPDSLVTINTGALNIREEADADSDSLGTYKQGDQVSILETDGHWGRTDKGWINLNYVKFPTSSGSYTEGDTTVTASALHIRKKASASSDSLGTYKKGDRVTILEVSGNWGRTDKGWINLKYTDATASGSSSVSGKYKITIETPDNGSIKANGTTAGKGATVTLTATPASGYKLGSVEVVDANGNPVTVTNNKTFTMPAANVTIKATFVETETETYEIEINASGSGTLTTSPADAAAAGTKVYLLAAPADEYSALSSISVKETESGKTIAVTNNTYFTMPAAKVTITASFATGSTASFAVNIDEGIENGTVTANTSYAAKGAKVNLTIAPAEGYVLKSITVKDSDNKAVTVSGSGNSRTFAMPEKDVTISAEFSTSQYTVSVSKTGSGNVAINPTKCSIGTEVTVAITPDAGYQLASGGLKVYGPNNKLIATGDETGVTFDMPGSNVTVKVIFELIPHEVNPNIGSEGTVTFNKTTAAKGDKVSLTIKPDEGYTVDKVTVKDSADKSITVSGSGNSRTFTMPADDVEVEVTFKLATYTVKATTSRCKVSVTPASTNMGETVTMTIVSTSKDYTNLKLTVKTGTTELSYTEVEDPTLENGIYTYVYSFEMPAGNVAINASFTK